MNNAKVVATADLGNPGAGWQAIGTGDFNGDGRADILFQSSAGAVDIWQMSGPPCSPASPSATPGRAGTPSEHNWRKSRAIVLTWLGQPATPPGRRAQNAMRLRPGS